MMDLDELNDAMDAPPDFEPAPLDLAHVMAAGGRLRRRRQFAVAGVSGLALAALLAGGGQLMTGTGPVSVQAAYPGPSGPVPSAINSSAPGILGKVVNTGRWLDGRQWILYVETVDPDRLDENMTLVLGRTKTGYINDFTVDLVGQDAGDGRMAPGFHAVRAGTVTAGRTTPVFGYYAGEPTRITARDSTTGRTVEAHVTAWSGFAKTEQARIFWFDFTQGTQPARLTDLTAYNAAGGKMPE
jgi:hypothetical protein